jgi:hypothetical protein
MGSTGILTQLCFLHSAAESADPGRCLRTLCELTFCLTRTALTNVDVTRWSLVASVPRSPTHLTSSQISHHPILTQPSFNPSRSHSSGDMASRVTFAKADAGTPATYTEHLQGASAVIISVGAPPVPNWFYAGGKAVGCRGPVPLSTSCDHAAYLPSLHLLLTHTHTLICNEPAVHRNGHTLFDRGGAMPLESTHTQWLRVCCFSSLSHACRSSVSLRNRSSRTELCARR